MQELYEQQLRKQEALLNRKNEKTDFYNGIYDRWKYPVLTREHVPLYWRYDLNPETNPYFMERLGINAVFNAGAIELDGKICLVARVEGSDRKSFFAVAESTTGVDQFIFREKPVQLPDCDPNETNVYDMRLTKHEDGWIYGSRCTGWHCPDKGFEYMGTAAESDYQAESAAAECLPAPEVCRWKVCVLYSPDGWLY